MRNDAPKNAPRHDGPERQAWEKRLRRKKTIFQKKHECWLLVHELADLTENDLDVSRAILQSFVEQAREIVNQPTWGHNVLETRSDRR